MRLPESFQGHCTRQPDGLSRRGVGSARDAGGRRGYGWQADRKERIAAAFRGHRDLATETRDSAPHLRHAAAATLVAGNPSVVKFGRNNMPINLASLRFPQCRFRQQATGYSGATDAIRIDAAAVIVHSHLDAVCAHVAKGDGDLAGRRLVRLESPLQILDAMLQGVVQQGMQDGVHVTTMPCRGTSSAPLIFRRARTPSASPFRCT